MLRFLQVAWDLLSPLATTGVVIFLARNWLLTRLQNSIKHEYDSKLEVIKLSNSERIEELKGQLNQQAALLGIAHKSLGDLAAPFHQESLEGIVKLWNGFLKMDACVPSVLTTVDVYLPSEYVSGINKGSFFKISVAEEMKILMDDGEPIESVRPFVGEYLWNMFFIYRAALGRVAYLYRDGIEKKELRPWFEDKNTRGLVRSLMTEDEFRQLESQPVGKLTFFRGTVRRNFAIAAGSAASGKEAGEAQLKEAQRLSRAMFEEEQRTAVASAAT